MTQSSPAQSLTGGGRVERILRPPFIRSWGVLHQGSAFNGMPWSQPPLSRPRRPQTAELPWALFWASRCGRARNTQSKRRVVEIKSRTSFTHVMVKLDQPQVKQNCSKSPGTRVAKGSIAGESVENQTIVYYKCLKERERERKNTNGVGYC